MKKELIYLDKKEVVCYSDQSYLKIVLCWTDHLEWIEVVGFEMIYHTET